MNLCNEFVKDQNNFSVFGSEAILTEQSKTRRCKFLQEMWFSMQQPLLLCPGNDFLPDTAEPEHNEQVEAGTGVNASAPQNTARAESAAKVAPEDNIDATAYAKIIADAAPTGTMADDKKYPIIKKNVTAKTMQNSYIIHIVNHSFK